jgi:hypothetical protein
MRERNTFYFREVPWPEPQTVEGLHAAIAKAFHQYVPVWAHNDENVTHGRKWNGSLSIYRHADLSLIECGYR